MAFRDETEALRAQVRMLESDLAAAEQRAQELAESHAEAAQLRERVRALQEELEKLRPAPKPEEPRRMPAAPSEHARKRRRRIAGWTAAAVGVLALGGTGWVLLVNDRGGVIDTDAEPTVGIIVLGESPSPPGLSNQVVGKNPVAELDARCRGYVPDQPLLLLRASEPMEVRLTTRSSSDTVLLLVDARGRVHCDDDSGSLMNASLTRVLAPGDHRVWVGTYRPSANASFQLVVVGRRSTEPPNETRIASTGRDGSSR